MQSIQLLSHLLKLFVKGLLGNTNSIAYADDFEMLLLDMFVVHVDLRFSSS